MPRGERNSKSEAANPRVRGLNAAVPPCGGRVRTVEELLEELVHAVEARGASRPGETPGSLLDIVVGRIRCTLSTAGDRDDPARAGRSLSPREREIAQMIARGLPNKVIAAVLEISLWTVGTHIRRLFAKLGVQSRAAAVALLLQSGEIRWATGGAGGAERDGEGGGRAENGASGGARAAACPAPRGGDGGRAPAGRPVDVVRKAKGIW